jgi:hypothetical protein
MPRIDQDQIAKRKNLMRLLCTFCARCVRIVLYRADNAIQGERHEANDICDFRCSDWVDIRLYNVLCRTHCTDTDDGYHK